MRWLHTFLFSLTLISSPAMGAYAQETAIADAHAREGDDLRVWLVTAGPGDAVWERYGHNAIRVENTRTGRDISYNWGIFDFAQIDFIPRFLQGRMLYRMEVFPTAAMVDGYARANREVVLQELDLTPAQKIELRELADANARPGNRDYLYQYFTDNCSTRVRDLLDEVLDGMLRSAFKQVETGRTYRDNTRRLTQVDPLIYTGMDFLLGTPTDAAITVWEEMFLPLALRDELRGISIADGAGRSRPLVIAEETVEANRAEEPNAAPRWLVIYLIVGLILGGTLSAVGADRERTATLLRGGVVAIAVAWVMLGGVLGLILVLLLFTDHAFASWNENLFLFNPILLALGVVLPFASARPACLPYARGLSLTIAGVGVLGLLWQIVPASQHQNAMFFAVALPAHVGLAWGLHVSGRLEAGTASGQRGSC